MLVALMPLVSLSLIAKPNIVYIMADDLGYGEVGCFGQKLIPTPNVDRLAREGVRFTRFYAASPVCAPTRASLLTGKHQGHAVIRGNKEVGGFGPNDPEGQFPLPKSEITVAEVLRRGGYATALVGKWGLGGPGPDQNPLDHGFDRFYGYLCQRRAHNYYPAYLWSDRQPDLLGNPVFDAHQKITAPLATENDYYQRFGGPTYAPAKMAEACLDFIDKHAKQPFFLYFAPTLPHLALQAPKTWVDKFPPAWDAKPYLGGQGYLPTARPRATYAAMIAYLDHIVGQILDELDRRDLTRNTLVIFTSDNGATFNGGVDRAFFHSNGELRDGKMTVYEGGIRVPFVARWPGKIRPETSTDSVATAYDTMATLSQIVGQPAPCGDGTSYLSALTGKSDVRREYVYFEYPEATSQQAVIFGNLKAVRPNLIKNPGLVEVYDLATDIGETHDLARDRPDIVRRALEVFRREHVPNRDFPLPGVDKS